MSTSADFQWPTLSASPWYEEQPPTRRVKLDPGVRGHEHGPKRHRQPIKWPRVRFQNEDRSVELVVLPDCRLEVYGNEEPYSKGCRTQIPLTAGGAMTIHKSQGMALDKIIVHLADVFQAEQVYVGLSRAKST